MTPGRSDKKSRRKPQSRSRPVLNRVVEVLKANRKVFRIYLLFGFTLLVFFTATTFPPVFKNTVLPLNEFLAWSSAKVLGILGNEGIRSSGVSVSSSEYAIDIAEGCNGIYALSIVLAGIIAVPARWRPKSVGLVLAVVLIMILNYVRILTLWYAGLTSAFLFDTMHLYVWECIIIALGAGYWYWWYERFVKRR
jgi:exosortase H (IPTLxxWG-CTERM-specific)